ncbi:MAG: NADPH:quinone oxidoreductase family protein [Deltaproteobacteria bacterium]|nr:NADPH:quinone oxidoreductase family protein [Deltaproteobacteria bacterium]
MRAVVCTSFSGPDGLEIREIPLHSLKEDEVLVKVHAIGVNLHDVLLVKGLHQMKPPFPFVPGSAASGVVMETGRKVKRVKPGDRVTCGGMGGAYARKMVSREHWVSRLPDEVDYLQGASYRSSYGTAYFSLVNRGRLRRGEYLVVHGAAGGIGLAAVDIGRLLGARVIGCVGSDDKIPVVFKHGASDVINYEKQKLDQSIKKLTHGKGADVVIDVVGGKVFVPSLRALSWNGRMLVVGFASGEIPEAPMNLPLLKNASIIGVLYGPWIDLNPEKALEINEILLGWMAEGKLKVYISHVFSFDQAKDAMKVLEERRAIGKVVIKVR